MTNLNESPLYHTVSILKNSGKKTKLSLLKNNNKKLPCFLGSHIGEQMLSLFARPAIQGIKSNTTQLYLKTIYKVYKKS